MLEDLMCSCKILFTAITVLTRDEERTCFLSVYYTSSASENFELKSYLKLEKEKHFSCSYLKKKKKGGKGMKPSNAEEYSILII